MKIDFSPIQGTVNHMALQLSLFSLIVVILGFLLMFLVRLLKIPKFLAQPIFVIGTLFIMYKVFLFIVH